MDLILTDTHLGLYKNSKIWHTVVIRLFEEVVDFCNRNNIKRIFHLGDFFHDRKEINTITLYTAKFIVEMLKDFEVILLVGNHDSFYKNNIEYHTLKVFDKYDNIKVVDSTMNFGNISCVPWSGNIDEATGKYCLGHFEINGFLMNDYFECKRGINKKLFKKFDKVLSGHFHKKSEYGNITYLGSPFQQTFNDAGNIHGYYTFDDGELEFYEFTNYPHYVIVNTDDINESEVPGNIVKVLFDKDYGTNKNNKILDDLWALNPLQLKTNLSKMPIDEIINEEDSDDIIPLDHVDIIKEYIDKVEIPSNIKKDTLLKMFLDLKNKL